MNLHIRAFVYKHDMTCVTYRGYIENIDSPEGADYFTEWCDDLELFAGAVGADADTALQYAALTFDDADSDQQTLLDIHEPGIDELEEFTTTALDDDQRLNYLINCEVFNVPPRYDDVTDFDIVFQTKGGTESQAYSEFAEDYADACGSIPSFARRYVDFEQMGQDMANSYDVVNVDGSWYFVQ